jgi:DNA-directed RNA polymerase specialized sigma24 family protein
MAEAFRDLHGSRLHGFAILVTLGETRSAELAAGDALAAGAQRAAALRHPERAAAWLRARTLRGLRQGISRNASTPVAARREALANLGVDEAVFQGLAALGVEARAALVASAIEQFEPIDIESILGAGPAGTRRMIAEARDRYLRVVGDLPAGQPGASPDYPGGELATRVRGVAARTISAAEGPQ